MKEEQRERLIDALLGFVERAAEEKATPAEVAALADVAGVLAELERINP